LACADVWWMARNQRRVRERALVLTRPESRTQRPGPQEPRPSAGAGSGSDGAQPAPHPLPPLHHRWRGDLACADAWWMARNQRRVRKRSLVLTHPESRTQPPGLQEPRPSAGAGSGSDGTLPAPHPCPLSIADGEGFLTRGDAWWMARNQRRVRKRSLVLTRPESGTQRPSPQEPRPSAGAGSGSDGALPPPHPRPLTPIR